MAHSHELTPLLSAIFLEHDWSDWRARLMAAGVTFGIMGTIGDHLDDPQVAANGLLRAFADGGGMRTLDSPFAVAGEAKTVPRMAPGVGQHTAAILKELGES
jgi:crotonobetainyl-CoA:carnitine CoA-transferase CaiB-like acyl-CoA transferase